MSALGFYPVTPGSDQFVFGSPLFRNAVIHLENGRNFTIRAPRTSSANRYINHVMRDGLPYAKSYVTYADIAQGSTFIFGMDAEPNPRFGARPGDRPFARVEKTIVENPVFRVPSPAFNAFTKVEIESPNKEARIWYQMVPEGSVAGGDFELYERPFTVSRSCTIYAYCTDKEGKRSFTTQTSLRRIENSYKVHITHPYSRLYSGGGDQAIVDGIRGGTNFRVGGWQGYQDCDFEAVIDMGTERHLSQLSAGFLQDTRSWIILPVWVEFYTSRNGKDFVRQRRLEQDVDPQDYTCQIREFTIPVDVDARYIKIVAKNFGTLPEWHLGAGGQAHLFVDEVTIL
jgi:hypothetical protein